MSHRSRQILAGLSGLVILALGLAVAGLILGLRSYVTYYFVVLHHDQIPDWIVLVFPLIPLMIWLYFIVERRHRQRQLRG